MFSRSRYLLIATRWMCLQKFSTLKNIKFVERKLIPPTIRFCTQKRISIVYYEEIKDLPNHPEKLLIDVRDRNEVRFGKIPQSINIPLCELRDELAVNDCDCDPEEFRKKYGRPKPTTETYIILHCRTGQRAAAAAEIAYTMGYRNVHNYCGSWLDYVRNETCK